MMWWFRVHRLGWVAMATVVMSLASALLGAVAFLFPSLGAGTSLSTVPLTAVMPLLLSVIVAWSMARGEVHAPVRRTQGYEYAVIGSVLAVFGLASVLVVPVGVQVSIALGGFRNMASYLAIAVLFEALFPRRYQLVPAVLYLFLAAVFGRESPGAPAWWAWVVTTNPAPAYTLPAVLLVAAACAVAVVRSAKG